MTYFIFDLLSILFTILNFYNTIYDNELCDSKNVRNFSFESIAKDRRFSSFKKAVKPHVSEMGLTAVDCSISKSNRAFADSCIWQLFCEVT